MDGSSGSGVSFVRPISTTTHRPDLAKSLNVHILHGIKVNHPTRRKEGGVKPEAPVKRIVQTYAHIPSLHIE